MKRTYDLCNPKILKHFCWLLLVAAIAHVSLFAAMKRVPSDYATISAAIAAASAGDTIRVYSNNSTPYVEHVNVNKSLVLIGSWPDTVTTIAAPGDFLSNNAYRYPTQQTLFNSRAALVRIAPGTSVVMKGFIVDGGNPNVTPAVAFTGILVDSASATIKANKVMGFLPDTSGTPDSSLSGRGIEVLGGSYESTIDSNTVLTCQRYHILVSATDDKTITPGIFPKATVSRNTVTGVGRSKLAQKGIWFNWGAYGRVINNTLAQFDYSVVTPADRASGIIVKHGEYRAGGASRILISGNTVSASTSNNNKGIFIEGKGDSIVSNVVSGFHFNVQVDDEDSAYVLKNTITGGKVGVLVTRTTPPGATDPFHVVIGGTIDNKNSINGQPKTNQNGAAIQLSFREDIETDGNFTSTIPVVATYNDFGVYSAIQIDSVIYDRKDAAVVPPIDTVLFSPFYVDKIRASVKVFLQGPYDASVGADSMKNTLQTAGHLASHFGGTIPALAVDSVNIELRNATTTAGSTTRKFAPAWLMTNGTIRNFTDPTKSYVEFDTTMSGQYHVVVRHRNHLAVMDSLPQTLDGSTTPTTYDFCTGLNKAYGTSPMASAGTRFAMWAGDVTGNGVLRYNLAGNDRLPILTRIGGTNINATVNGYYNEDVNMNGVVRYNLSGNDRLIILTNVGGTNINAIRSSEVP